MLRSYLKLALRSLFRYKMHSSISVLGLAIGFACFIIVFVFIAHEMSYDAFHENAERLYRVRSDLTEKRSNIRDNYATIRYSTASLLKSDFPEIEDIVCVRRYGREHGPFTIRTNTSWRIRFILQTRCFLIFSPFP